MKDTPIENVSNTTSILNGQWPSDTWFRRARARKLKAEAAELELEAANDTYNNMPSVQS